MPLACEHVTQASSGAPRTPNCPWPHLDSTSYLHTSRSRPHATSCQHNNPPAPALCHFSKFERHFLLQTSSPHVSFPSCDSRHVKAMPLTPPAYTYALAPAWSFPSHTSLDDHLLLSVAPASAHSPRKTPPATAPDTRQLLPHACHASTSQPTRNLGLTRCFHIPHVTMQSNTLSWAIKSHGMMA